jgi:hypothetical protein
VIVERPDNRSRRTGFASAFAGSSLAGGLESHALRSKMRNVGMTPANRIRSEGSRVPGIALLSAVQNVQRQTTMKLIRNEESFEVESFDDYGIDDLDLGFDLYV